MSGTRVGSEGRKRFYYRCPNYAANWAKACSNKKNIRAEPVEVEVCSWLKHPECLRAGVQSYVEQERRGDPEGEMRLWAKRLAEVDAKRSRYQDMAAEGLIDFDELRSKLDALEAVRSRAERLASLKLETEVLIEAYSSKARAGLDLYTPQDKFDAYKALALRVIAHPDSRQELIGGPLRSNEKTPSG